MSGYGTFPAYSEIPPLRKKMPASYVPYSVPIPTAANDPIVKMELSVSPSGDGEMWPSFLSTDGVCITWWLADGVPGRNYTVQIKTLTESRPTEQWLYSVLCAPAIARWQLPPEPCPGFGPPLSWSQGQKMYFGPALTLPPVTVEATGTTQIGAAIAPLAKVLVNAAQTANAGILLPQASTFCGNTLPVVNVSGVPVTIYPFAGDTIGTNAVNVGIVIQDQSSANFWVSQSGLLIVS